MTTEPSDPLTRAIFAHTDARVISNLDAIRKAAGVEPAEPETEPQPDPGFDAMDDATLLAWADANRLVIEHPGGLARVPGLLRGLAARGELEYPDSGRGEED